MAIANIVKSSLGPVGLDKMLVDELGDVTITNDGATMLKQLEVEHPAGKILVELAQLQDQEVGDGTTSVVIIAAELLKRANELFKNGIHPTTVISGYNLARHEACKFIAERMAIKVDTLGHSSLISCAKTAMSSKIIHSESEFFSEMVLNAVLAVKVEEKGQKAKYPIGAINVLKAHGRSNRESELINGYALNLTRASQSMPKRVYNAKICLLDIDLRKAKMALGVQILITDAKEVENIQKKEGQITEDRIKMILNAGANVILTTKGIDDLALKYFSEAGAIAVRRVSKKDMRHIAKATGATLLLSLGDMEGNETISPAMFGSAEQVCEEKVGDGELIYIKGCKSTKAQTIVLRGANDFMLDEIERSVHDALSIVKRTLESNTVVPGGGACEVACSVYLEHIAETLGSQEQLAIAEYAQALLVIPKTLAVNGAQDATELVAHLRAHHIASQSPEESKDSKTADYKYSGLDLYKGKIQNSLAKGVLEPAVSKVKSLRFATEAAVSIIRIDDHMKMNPKIDPKGPHGR